MEQIENKTNCQNIIEKLDNSLFQRNVYLWEVTNSQKNGLLSEFLIMFFLCFSIYQSKYEMMSYEMLLSTDNASTMVKLYLVYAIVRRFYKMKIFNGDRICKINKEIDSLKTELSPYCKYPDVNNYVINYNKEIEAGETLKRKFIIKLSVMRVFAFAAAIYLASIAPLHCLFDLKYDQEKKIMELYNNTEPQIIKNAPFISIKPYSNKIDEGNTFDAEMADFYLVKNEEISTNSYRRYLIQRWYLQTKISGIGCERPLRLLITDTTGTPLLHNLNFVFYAKDTIIKSAPLYKSDMAFPVLNYLHDNESNIRFKIERVR